jgi:hypothetical protein
MEPALMSRLLFEIIWDSDLWAWLIGDLLSKQRYRAAPGHQWEETVPALPPITSMKSYFVGPTASTEASKGLSVVLQAVEPHRTVHFIGADPQTEKDSFYNFIERRAFCEACQDGPKCCDQSSS